jgi:four helix bundle protein
MADEFRLMQLIREVARETRRLIATARPRLLDEDQISRALGSIGRNVREGYGRRKGPERNQFLRYARGSAEEVDQGLKDNFEVERIEEKQFWRLHHRLTLICKMLTSIMGRDA